MAHVRREVSELIIDDPDNLRRVVLRGGDEVPDWALEIYHNPRVIDLEEIE